MTTSVKFKSVMVAVMLLSLFATAGVKAQSAYSTQFTTSIAFSNVGSGPANISLDIYNQQNGTAVASGLTFTLNANAGTSFFVGSVGALGSSFNGSAVLSADQPLAATLVQSAPAASVVKNRALSNGFTTGEAKVLLPTVLKAQFGPNNTKFSVQNVDSVAADISVKFFLVGATTPTFTDNIANLPPNAAKYYDLGTIAGITTATFNGAVVIESVQDGSSTAGKVVATSMELGTTLPTVYAYEGIPASQAANDIYMPTALCNVFGGQSSFYAVQNTSLTAGDTAQVTITYRNATSGAENTTTAVTINPGGKTSFNTCDAVPAGFSGSAKITSVGAKIVSIAKVSGGGITASLEGKSAGSSKLALPYVRWSETRWNAGDRTRQHADIAIQNIGSDLAAGSVTVKYYDKDGKLVGTHTLGAFASKAKLNSKPTLATANGTYNGTTTLSEFGYYGATNSPVGGGAVIEGPSGSQLIATVRITSFPATGLVGEDYTAIPAQ